MARLLLQRGRMVHSHHRTRDHVGELAVELWAPDLAGLFQEAAKALAEIIGGRAPAGPTDGDGPARDIWISAHDREALLVDWLNELVFLCETDGMLYGSARVFSANDHGLHAELRGRRLEHPAVAVKAATFHGLRVREADGGLGATVVFDV